MCSHSQEGFYPRLKLTVSTLFLICLSSFGQKFIFDCKCKEALEVCRGFASRIQNDNQAAKMAGGWHVENLWGCFGEEVRI